MRLSVFFRFGRKDFDIIFLTYFISAGKAVAAGDEAAGKQFVSNRFLNGDGLARQKRFVDFYRAFFDNGIGRYLIADREMENIVQHDFAGGNFRFHAVSYNFCRTAGHQRKLFDRMFRSDLLYDSDADIKKVYDTEKETVKRRVTDDQRNRA